MDKSKQRNPYEMRNKELQDTCNTNVVLHDDTWRDMQSWDDDGAGPGNDRREEKFLKSYKEGTRRVCGASVKITKVIYLGNRRCGER